MQQTTEELQILLEKAEAESRAAQKEREQLEAELAIQEADLLRKQQQAKNDLNQKKFFKFNNFTKPKQAADAIPKIIIEPITAAAAGAAADTLAKLLPDFSLDPKSNKIKPKIVIAYDLHQQLESELAKYTRKYEEYLNAADYRPYLIDEIQLKIKVHIDLILNQQQDLFASSPNPGDGYISKDELEEIINPYRSLEINPSSGLLSEFGDDTFLNSVYKFLQTPLDLITHIQYLKTQPPPAEEVVPPAVEEVPAEESATPAVPAAQAAEATAGGAVPAPEPEPAE